LFGQIFGVYKCLNCGLTNSPVRRVELVSAIHSAWATRVLIFSSGRLLQFARGEVHRIGRALVKRLVRAASVVKTEVVGQRLVDLLGRLVGVQVNVLVLDAFPQPLDKYVGVSSRLRRLAMIRADVSG
jgi:hypothetical protein